MPRVAYVDGRYRPFADAAVHVEDRGLQFADSVYEVILVHCGHLVDEDPHLDRLERSLGEIRLAAPLSRQVLKIVIREIARRNRVETGMIYVQVTRGVAPRLAAFPKVQRPSVIVYSRRIAPPSAEVAEQGVKVVTVPDLRWGRCDIKSTALLANVLAKQAGIDAGCFDSWQVDEKGFVTEGSAANAWIVTKAGELVTRPATPEILNGITRRTVIALARELGLAFVERPFTADEAKSAREAFQTSASAYVTPVTEIDGRPIGNGRAGSLSRSLLERYLRYAEAS